MLCGLVDMGKSGEKVLIYYMLFGKGLDVIKMVVRTRVIGYVSDHN